MNTSTTAQLGAAQCSPRATVDAYSYNAGIEAAAGLCEVPVKPFDGGDTEPAAPVHARWIRQAKLEAAALQHCSAGSETPSPLHDAVVAYLTFLRKSVNVGPLTKNPSKEAALLRRIMELTSFEPQKDAQ